MRKIIILIISILPINVFSITASSYIVMDSDNLRVLEGNNINKQSLIASTTKIMTAMVVINNRSLNKKVTIGNEVLKSYGSGIYITPGEILTRKDLLYGLMLRSGNDAAIALSYNIGGSMEGFTTLMNNLASSLNMKDTLFINSHGLEDNDKGNISTVYDMALLSSYAIKNKTYQKIVSTKKIKVTTNLKTYIWNNKNKLLNEYKYCVGGKTGYTKKAKRTLVTNASKKNINLTIVTFNDSNDFKDHENLYNKYLKELKNYNILTKGLINTKYKNTYINKSYNMSLTTEEYKKLKLEIEYLDKPITNVIGYIKVKLNGKIYFKTEIIKEDSTKKKNIFSKIKSIFN